MHPHIPPQVAFTELVKICFQALHNKIIYKRYLEFLNDMYIVFDSHDKLIFHDTVHCNLLDRICSKYGIGFKFYIVKTTSDCDKTYYGISEPAFICGNEDQSISIACFLEKTNIRYEPLIQESESIKYSLPSGVRVNHYEFDPKVFESDDKVRLDQSKKIEEYNESRASVKIKRTDASHDTIAISRVGSRDTLDKIEETSLLSLSPCSPPPKSY